MEQPAPQPLAGLEGRIIAELALLQSRGQAADAAGLCELLADDSFEIKRALRTVVAAGLVDMGPRLGLSAAGRERAVRALGSQMLGQDA